MTFREEDRGNHLTFILQVCLIDGTRKLKGHTCQLCRSIVGPKMAVLLSDAYMYVLLSLVDLVVHTIVGFFFFLFCTRERQWLGCPNHHVLVQTVRRRSDSFFMRFLLPSLVP